MTGQSGAELLVRALRSAGVEVVFTLSGNQILPIYDAGLDVGLRFIDTRHENAAVHMAEAYARITGSPGVCLVTAGPGHTNALTGLGNALCGESAVLLLSGASERGRAGTGAFQELDQVALAGPLTRGSWLAERAEDIPALVSQAWRAMLGGRPGPAHLSLPADVLTETTESTADDCPSLAGEMGGALHSGDLELAARWLAAADRPLILGGPSCGWGESGRAYRALVSAAGGLGWVLESPRGLADPALQGVGAAFREADVVVLAAPQDFVAGFAAREALATDGRLIQIAATTQELGPNRAPDLALVGDVGAVLQRLAAALKACPAGDRPVGGEWLARAAELRAQGRARFSDAEVSNDLPLHPLRVCSLVRDRLRPADVVVEDGGEFGQWARWAFSDGDQRVLVNGKLGMIGCGLPMALGAQVADPSARVVVFLGDGTFGFHGLELDTAVRHGLPVIVVVGNDSGWSAERHRQLALYGPDRLVAANLLETRYDRVAQALGAQGEFVENTQQLSAALDRAFASGQPTCLNVRIASIPSPAAAAAK